MDGPLTTFSRLAGNHRWHIEKKRPYILSAFFSTGRRHCVCINFLMPISMCNFVQLMSLCVCACVYYLRQVVGTEWEEDCGRCSVHLIHFTWSFAAALC